jgi:DNA polymerase III alpha subunit
MRTGLSEEDGEDLFRRCSAFAEFGFARAHAAAFAKITYDTAWLKQRYPASTTPASSTTSRWASTRRP